MLKWYCCAPRWVAHRAAITLQMDFLNGKWLCECCVQRVQHHQVNFPQVDSEVAVILLGEILNIEHKFVCFVFFIIRM